MEKVVGDIGGWGWGIGDEFVLIEGLGYGKGVVRGEVEVGVGLVLEGGKVVEKGGLLGGLFGVKGFKEKLGGMV